MNINPKWAVFKYLVKSYPTKYYITYLQLSNNRYEFNLWQYTDYIPDLVDSYESNIKIKH